MWLGGWIDQSALETGTIPQAWSPFISLSSAQGTQRSKRNGFHLFSWHRALAGTATWPAFHLVLVDASGPRLLKARGFPHPRNPTGSGPSCFHVCWVRCKVVRISHGFLGWRQNCGEELPFLLGAWSWSIQGISLPASPLSLMDGTTDPKPTGRGEHAVFLEANQQSVALLSLNPVFAFKGCQGWLKSTGTPGFKCWLSHVCYHM